MNASLRLLFLCAVMIFTLGIQWQPSVLPDCPEGAGELNYTVSTNEITCGPPFQSPLGYAPLNPANNLSDVNSTSTSLVNLGGQINLAATAKDGAGTTILGTTLTSRTHGDVPCYDGSGTPTWRNCEPGPATNTQTGNYAILGTSATSSGDKGKVVRSNKSTAAAYTIAQAGSAGFDALYSVRLCSVGTGATTLTPATSTINGAAALVLRQWDCADINSDGANYHASVSRNPPKSFGGSFDGGGSALVPGTTVPIAIPFSCTISAWSISVDTGTATFDLWKIATGTALPTVSNTITSTKPAIASNTHIRDTSPSGEFSSLDVTGGDVLIVKLDAVSSATKANITVECML